VTTNATTSGGAVGPNDASPGQTPVPGFTPEQVQRILSLIDNQKAGNEKLQGRIEWLYDTGASCHMTGHFEILENVKKINPITVGLPDGNEAAANKIKNVRFGLKMVLQGVLFVPKLKCNLISIWKLSKGSNCIVIFTDNFCVIQDRFSRNLIGMDRVKGGVFLHKEVLKTQLKLTQSGLMIYGTGISVILAVKFFLYLLKIWMLVIFSVIKWMNLVIFVSVLNKPVAHFLKVIVKLVNLLNSYIVIFGVPIMFHQLVGHIIF